MDIIFTFLSWSGSLKHSLFVLDFPNASSPSCFPTTIPHDVRDAGSAHPPGAVGRPKLNLDAGWYSLKSLWPWALTSGCPAALHKPAMSSAPLPRGCLCIPHHHINESSRTAKKAQRACLKINKNIGLESRLMVAEIPVLTLTLQKLLFQFLGGCSLLK